MAWEEVYHLVSHLGYGCADPERWSTIEGSGSLLSDNLNVLIGDCGWRFNDTQTPRGPSCHYYYTDPTCFYSCTMLRLPRFDITLAVSLTWTASTLQLERSSSGSRKAAPRARASR